MGDPKVLAKVFVAAVLAVVGWAAPAHAAPGATPPSTPSCLGAVGAGTGLFAPCASAPTTDGLSTGAPIDLDALTAPSAGFVSLSGDDERRAAAAPLVEQSSASSPQRGSAFPEGALPYLAVVTGLLLVQMTLTRVVRKRLSPGFSH
jgi:hypothetical protein